MRNVIILGAAGRDFHNFNVYFRDNKQYNVVAFTASQIPFISNRVYPKELAGELYPNGIPIYDEYMLEELIKRYEVNEVVFAYSDVSYEHVMHLASKAIACGASFRLLGLKDTQLVAKKPVIAITANRTGAGKSTLTRTIARILDKRVAIIRHPMPYLTFQAVQHFKDVNDLEKYQLSIEEEEEYTPHLKDGNEVYAGVDYSLILKEAEKDHDVIIWDGGNNDFPFIKPDLNIYVIDPLRVNDTIRYYPSEVNLRLADVIIINKANLVHEQEILKCINICKNVNDKARIFKIGMFATLNADIIRNKRIVIVSDAPSITHGELKYNMALEVAKCLGCKIIDPKAYAKGSIKEMYERYDINNVLPAAGYSKEQLIDLENTISYIECDAIVLATPVDLARRIRINKPVTQMELHLASYDYNAFISYIKDILKKL